jgi:hypothetical protein
MVFNATFNNISAISWQSVLLVEETGVPQQMCNKNTLKNNRVVGFITTYAISAYHH